MRRLWVASAAAAAASAVAAAAALLRTYLNVLMSSGPQHASANRARAFRLPLPRLLLSILRQLHVPTSLLEGVSVSHMYTEHCPGSACTPMALAPGTRKDMET